MTSIADDLRIPCGQVLPNRLAKAAMTEGLGDGLNRATEKHVALYRRWANSGCGMLLTGNVQIDRWHLERAGNVAIDGPQDADRLARLRAWSAAAKSGGARVWMQISNAGRQTVKAINPHPKAPSAVKLNLPGGQFGDPVALTEPEILDFIARFGNAAAVAREAGFDGVQIHGAHGYLLSEFLSPRANLRTDRWGGSIENRARFLLETIKAVRAATAPDFAVSVKLNSADFQKGGFSGEDSLKVAEMLNNAGIDLLEISGGTYEQPRMAGMDGVEPSFDEKVRASTRAREAYFIEYAAAMAKVVRVPLMVTGGFRTRACMEAALTAGEAHVIGLGRPLCGDPLAAKKLLAGGAALPAYEKTLRIGPGWLGPASPITALKLINGWGAQGWYCLQLLRMGDGKDPDLKMGVWSAFNGYRKNEEAAAKALQR